MTETRVEIHRAAAETLVESMEALGPLHFDHQDRAFGEVLQASCGWEAIVRNLAGIRRIAPDRAGDGALKDRSLGVVGEGTYGSYSSDAADISRVVPTGFRCAASSGCGRKGAR